MKGFFLILILYLDLNQRIYVSEEGNWVAKGRYKDAIADDEEVEWLVAEGKSILHLWTVSF